jgi:ribosomal protein S18 acetylase RimI-like enzyme
MDPAVHIELGDANTADKVFEPVCQLYAAVFSAPPLNRPPEKLASQRRGLRSLMTEPTFGMAMAWSDDQLVGFVYGYALGTGTRWWEGFLTPVAEDITREWDGRTFVIIDMGVALSRQRLGVGKQLLNTLLASRPEERASLSVVPENKQAQAFYRRLGWQCVGRVKGAPHHAAPSFDIYVLNLR